ncbi:MAG: PstS family phosphate ABC transporter substrate-binding protein [Oscillatoria sp. SIO1A7]|nr:PstS family phosphate ABC transporter substrate-binding protein [Oscillatoria sp. SIO1A7]
MHKSWKLAGALALMAATIAVAAPKVVKSQGTPTVRIDGSSTVFPISEAVAEEFQAAEGGRTRVTVGISGTGGGFKKFCSDNPSVRTDISDASRPIKQKEIDACKAQGIEFIELPVAYDAITVVVDKNNGVNSMTVAELKKIWSKSSQGSVTKWSDVRSGWPAAQFTLFGPGADSGTFDYFKEVILGKGNDMRTDFTPSEDDNVLVQGIAGNPTALGYFGLAYYEANKGRLKAVAIDGGNGPVSPSEATVNNGSYKPLSRPVYIYVNKQAVANKPHVKRFVEFYLQNAARLAKEVNYVALPGPDYQSAMRRFQGGQTGRVPLRQGL